MSALDGTARGHSVTCKLLKELRTLIPNKLSTSDQDVYDAEAHKYNVDIFLLKKK